MRRAATRASWLWLFTMFYQIPFFADSAASDLAIVLMIGVLDAAASSYITRIIRDIHVGFPVHRLISAGTLSPGGDAGRARGAPRAGGAPAIRDGPSLARSQGRPVDPQVNGIARRH